MYLKSTNLAKKIATKTDKASILWGQRNDIFLFGGEGGWGRVEFNDLLIVEDSFFIL